MTDDTYDTEPTQATIGLSTSSKGFYGWRVSFEPFGHGGDDEDNPNVYPVTVAMELDVGFFTGQLTPVVTIASNY